MVPAANLGDASSIDDTVLAGRPVAEAPLDEAMAGEESSDDEPSEDEPDFETDTAFELDDDPVPAMAEDVPGEVAEQAAEIVSAETDATVLAFPTTPDAGGDEEIDDDDMTATDIDDLFARLRADQPVDGAAEEPADEEAAGDEELESARPRSGSATRPSCR